MQHGWQIIGSGSAAKAILYYITDYITKSQLKVHVAYAALNLAVWRLEGVEIEKDDHQARAKHLLQKCAYSMLSHQELSALQVPSYLLGLGDYYTSRNYAYLYWTLVEHYVNTLDPSPECYPVKNMVPSVFVA